MKIIPPDNTKIKTFRPIENCARCLTVPAVSNHLCKDCYTAHNEWLKDLVSGTTTVKDGIKIDSDGFYTLYESGDKG